MLGVVGGTLRRRKSAHTVAPIAAGVRQNRLVPLNQRDRSPLERGDTRRRTAEIVDESLHA